MSMPRSADTFHARDGTAIRYTDWGHGPAIVFSHGWPQRGEAWGYQMMFLARHGYRVIAHDRRGHGYSGKPWLGNGIDDHADDLAQLIQVLRLRDVTLIGHSSGASEIVRYLRRHGDALVSQSVLVAAPLPRLLLSATNPEGVPGAVFDGMRSNARVDRSRFLRELADAFYDCAGGDAGHSHALREVFYLQGRQCSLPAIDACIAAFRQADYTEDLRRMTVPTMLIHGDADRIAPIGATARHAVTLLPHAYLVTYEGGPHGLPGTHRDRLNEDLLAFLQA